MDNILKIAATILRSGETRVSTLVEMSGMDPRTFFEYADLRGADLRGQDLRGFSFVGARLQGALVDEHTRLDGHEQERFRAYSVQEREGGIHEKRRLYGDADENMRKIRRNIEENVPISLVKGSRGSGKTTLLNRLSTQMGRTVIVAPGVESRTVQALLCNTLKSGGGILTNLSLLSKYGLLPRQFRSPAGIYMLNPVLANDIHEAEAWKIISELLTYLSQWLASPKGVVFCVDDFDSLENNYWFQEINFKNTRAHYVITQQSDAPSYFDPMFCKENIVEIAMGPDPYFAGLLNLGLTDRQRQILDFVVDGKTTKEIAEILGMSTRTVESHKAEIGRRAGSKTLFDLVNLLRRDSARSIT